MMHDPHLHQASRSRSKVISISFEISCFVRLLVLGLIWMEKKEITESRCSIRKEMDRKKRRCGFSGLSKFSRGFFYCSDNDRDAPLILYRHRLVVRYDR